MIPAPRRLVLAAALAAPAIARAQQQRPVTIVVPFAAGGSTDVLSRLMAERMTQIFLGRRRWSKTGPAATPLSAPNTSPVPSPTATRC